MRLARSVVRFFSLVKKPSPNGCQRGGVLLIPGLDATFAVKGSPDWMAVTKDAVWVASSSVNHVVRLDAKTNQPGTIVTVAKPCAGLVVSTAREGPLTPVGRGFQQDRMCGHLKKSRYAS